MHAGPLIILANARQLAWGVATEAELLPRWPDSALPDDSDTVSRQYRNTGDGAAFYKLKLQSRELERCIFVAAGSASDFHSQKHFKVVFPILILLGGFLFAAPMPARRRAETSSDNLILRSCRSRNLHHVSTLMERNRGERRARPLWTTFKFSILGYHAAGLFAFPEFDSAEPRS
jgi:hypothetical protein